MQTGAAIEHMTLTELAERLADPDQLAGGGAAAAATAALAAALAELVVQLSLRRRANLAEAVGLAADAQRLHELREDLFRAADRDIDAFAALQAAQREMRATENRDAYRAALLEAADSPLALSELAIEVMAIVERRLPNATRFVASDLVASSALCGGAVSAALVTADVNIELMDAEPAAPLSSHAAALRTRRTTLSSRSAKFDAALKPPYADQPRDAGRAR